MQAQRSLPDVWEGVERGRERPASMRWSMEIVACTFSIIAGWLVLCEGCIDAMQDIQELTSDTARKHGLSLRLWPMLDGATNPCPAQQISRLSLSECDTGYVEKPQGACQDDSPAVHGTDDQPESNSRQSATNHEHEGSSGDGSSRNQHHPLSTQPAALRPSQPDAEAANGPPSQSSSSSEVQARQDDGTAALPAAKAGDPHVQVLGTGGDARGRDIRSSSGSEQLILSRGTRVPGHSWLPCPNLATPDAAESDFLTVSTSHPYAHLHAVPGNSGTQEVV